MTLASNARIHAQPRLFPTITVSEHGEKNKYIFQASILIETWIVTYAKMSSCCDFSTKTWAIKWTPWKAPIFHGLGLHIRANRLRHWRTLVDWSITSHHWSIQDAQTERRYNRFAEWSQIIANPFYRYHSDSCFNPSLAAFWLPGKTGSFTDLYTCPGWEKLDPIFFSRPRTSVCLTSGTRIHGMQ